MMQSRHRQSRMTLIRMLLFLAVPATRGLLLGRSSLTRPSTSMRFSTCLFSQAALSSSSSEVKPKYAPTIKESQDSSAATTRKRLGKSSFLYKQNQQLGKEEETKATSAEELCKMAQMHSGKSIGSSQYKKAWTRWLYLAVESIREDLGADLLQDGEDGESIREAFEKLFFDLGVAADVGKMPSFESPAARIGYSLEFFCRGRALAEFLLETPPLGEEDGEAMYPEFWTRALRSPDCPLLAATEPSIASSQPCSYEIVSLGGGPGFDFVGVAMAAAFSFHTRGSSTNADDNTITSPTKIHVTAMDYEEGWSELVSAMDRSTQKILTPPTISSDLPAMSCDWGGKCDITKSILHEPVNANCKRLLLGDKQQAAARFWICQYCVAENAKALRASDYVFLKELVQEMSQGSMVLLTEVVPRLWPEMVRMLDREGLLPMVDVGFRKGYCGKQFLLKKRSTRRPTSTSTGEGPFDSLDKRTRDQLEHFEKLASYHERKVESGWKRQGRKENGSVYHEKQNRRLRKIEQE